MTEFDSQTVQPEDIVGRALNRVAYWSAILGGLIMSGLAIMVVVSVSGRYTLSMPIFGDFEMMAFGTAIATFLFLPYCQMQRGNVIVDLFLSWAPARVQGVCDLAGSLLLALISGMISWRMAIGLEDMIHYNEVTYILAIPLWWAFPFCVYGSGLLTLCALYTAKQDIEKILK